MTSVAALQGFSFDHGLESISRTVRTETPLPDAAHMPPAEQLNRPELERLLQRPNLRDFVAQQLQPAIDDRQLLTPQRFERTLRQAAQSLRDLSSTVGANQQAVVGKAARALAEEANLRELLNMYRSSLFQG